MRVLPSPVWLLQPFKCALLPFPPLGLAVSRSNHNTDRQDSKLLFLLLPFDTNVRVETLLCRHLPTGLPGYTRSASLVLTVIVVGR